MGFGTAFGEMRSLPVFPFLSDIETLYRTVVSHYSCVNQALASLLLILLQNQVMLLLCIHFLLYVGELLKLNHRTSGSIRVRR